MELTGIEFALLGYGGLRWATVGYGGLRWVKVGFGLERVLEDLTRCDRLSVLVSPSLADVGWAREVLEAEIHGGV